MVYQANINDLGLNEGEKKVLIRMLGPRYNPGNQELKLTTEKYSHRLENKKHLTYLIEQLVQASKELYPQAAQYPMDSE